MNEEYEIIFVPNEGRAIKNNKTKRIYYSEFQIIEEKNKEIERLNDIINKAIEYIKEHIRVDDEYPGYMEMLVEEKNELLNILKGEENE